jgi:hypothetical protein
VNRLSPLLFWIVILNGCGDDSSSPDPEAPYQPTGPTLLSTGSPTKDEDAWVLRTQDGAMLVAWFSDRGGNSDLYVTKTTDGTAWVPAARATTHPDRDFYPSLLQTAAGSFRLVWFRWDDAFRSHIVGNTSGDGVIWDESTEFLITDDANVDDWVPAAVEAPDGTLLVYFVSEVRNASNPTSEIYVVALPPGGSPSEPVDAGVNDPTMHDHLPSVARVGNEFVLVWMRYDTSATLPWQATKSDLYMSTSLDGLSWSVPAPITNDAGSIVHIFPSLTSTLQATWSIVWLSTRMGPARPFEMRLDEVDAYPSSAEPLSSLPDGYTHRVAATPNAAVRMGVWVQGPEGAQDVYVLSFSGDS